MVDSPKTAHHPGKGSREIPLFPELKPILIEAFEQAPDGAEYVVDERYRRAAMGAHGWRNCNLRTTFLKIVRNAGLQPWGRLFHAMRKSRETELVQNHPIHVVTKWLGNTPRVAMKHYLMVTDADYQKALQSPGKMTTEVLQNAMQHAAAPARTTFQETTQALNNKGLVPLGAIAGDYALESLAERTGFEPAED